MTQQMDMFGRLNPQPSSSRYPHEPGFKAHGTSREAARAIAPLANGIRGTVLKRFQERFPNGSTVDELARDLNLSPFTTRPRVSELHAQGLIEQTLERRPNDSGHSATVWRASTKAMEAANG